MMLINEQRGGGEAPRPAASNNALVVCIYVVGDYSCYRSTPLLPPFFLRNHNDGFQHTWNNRPIQCRLKH